ncbi:MAG: EF hand [Syntrophorhabdaceae bacterium PtaU1.Bin034]|nr:MAG: EF hand [Syntrophorhabdaceae bacterium PtaU1.Bin034]
MKKRSVIAALFVLIGCSFLSGGYAREVQQPVSGQPGSKVEKAATRKPASPKRANERSAFVGRIVEINPRVETLSVKGRGSTVTFDVSNPMLSGYKVLSDIRTGDRVAVVYIPNGIRVTKLTGKSEPSAKEEPHSVRQKGQTRRLQRPAKKGNGGTFDEVDANKDGRITPVELSVEITNITMDRFRQYDRTGDGYLDKNEFFEALRPQKTNR